MLRFKARRKDPTESPFLTPSQKRIMASLGKAMTKVRDASIRNEGQILDAILHGPPSRLIDLVPEDPWYEAQEALQSELTGELLAAGQRYGAMIPSVQKATVNFRFDAERPEAAAWAQKEAANLIVEVVEEQRAVVRDLASRASMGELAPRDAARQIRDVIGLTNQQAGWVQNYRARQVADLEAQGLSPSQIAQRADRATDRYHARIHRYRSENIARTEILRASNEGREQAWGQALGEGFISPNSSKQWSANLDGRVCPQCSGLNGTIVPLSGTFPGGNPPLHPSCRCDVLLLPEQTAGIETLQGLSDAELDALITGAESLAPSAPSQWVSFDDIPDNLEARNAYRESIENDFASIYADVVSDIPGTSVRVSVTPLDGKLLINATVTQPAEQARVLSAIRLIDPEKKTIEHQKFEIVREFQGQGIATRANKQFYDLYRERGIESVTLESGLDVGGYAWAKHGFDWDLDRYDDVSDLSNFIFFRIRDAQQGKKPVNVGGTHEGIDFGTPEYQRAEMLLERLDGPVEQWPTPVEIASLGWAEGKTTWAGKEALLGSVWYGRLEL